MLTILAHIRLTLSRVCHPERSRGVAHPRLAAARVLTATLLASSLMPAIAVAEQSPASEVEMFLRPHCESVAFRAAFPDAPAAPGGAMPMSDDKCAAFEVRDPQTMQTGIINPNDVLDMDLVVTNTLEKEIGRFRAWMAYDPSTLKGESMKISKFFPTPNPGEADFSEAEGIMKISGTADTVQKGKTIVLAQVKMRAMPAAQQVSPIVFYDASGGVSSHTGVFAKNGNQEVNQITAALGSLLVRLSGQAQSSSVSTVAMPPATSSMESRSSALSLSPIVSTASSVSSESSASSESSTPTVFTMLQAQNLRATTEGTSVFLAWNVLPSTELIGYNIEYGTISGQYIQKRGVDKSVTNMTIRGLPERTPYYFAIRGINAKGEETDFSQEVGITVGNAATSTSPLIGSVIGHSNGTPRTGGTLSGETGAPSTLMIFLALSAVIGTFVAFRRQLSAKSSL